MEPVDIYAVEHILQTLIIIRSVPDLVIEKVGVVQAHSLLQLQFLRSIEQMVCAQVGDLEAQAGLCRDPELAFLGLLRYHNDDTVGTARAVDSRGGGILEDVDALNLVVVVVHELRERDLKAVEDNERGVDGLGRILVKLLHVHGQRR